MQDGQGGATWRVVEGKQSTIWGIQDILGSSSSIPACFPTSSGLEGMNGGQKQGGAGMGMMPGATVGNVDATTHTSANNILASAKVKEVHLLEHKSTFKVPVGVIINCLPSHEMTAAGEAFCYTVLPESTNTVPLKLFQACEDNEESLRWKQEYPNYNAANLETEGVLEYSNSAFYFVHEGHPVITLLRANKDILRTDIDEQKMVANEWYKVLKQTFATCCNTLRNKVLSKLPITDLGKFSIELRRLGTRDWLDLQVYATNHKTLCTFSAYAHMHMIHLQIASS
jgi:hypothetical protein